MARIGFGLIEDGLQYEDYPEVRQPCLILHGLRDQVVPVAYAREFVRRHPDTASLVEFDTDHEMADVLSNLWNSSASLLFQ